MNWTQFMLHWFLRFPEFSKSSALFQKNLKRSFHFHLVFSIYTENLIVTKFMRHAKSISCQFMSLGILNWNKDSVCHFVLTFDCQTSNDNAISCTWDKCWRSFSSAWNSSMLLQEILQFDLILYGLCDSACPVALALCGGLCN